MVKIWAKTTIDGKLKKDVLFESRQDFSIDDFENYVREICYLLDIPTPITLVKHIKNFIMFNSCIYETDDFVEHINFEKLQLTNVV